MAALARAFGNGHLVSVGFSVPHDVRPLVAVYAPKPLLGMDVFPESVGGKAIFNGFSTPRPHSVVVGIAKIRFKAPFIIRAHVVSIVTV